MRLQATYDAVFDILTPTPFVLMLRPRSGAQQWIVREEYRFSAENIFEFTDSYGNLCQRLIAPSGRFSIYTSAEVITTDYMDSAPGAPFVEIQNLPDDVLCYLLPSRYCEAERFGQMATTITVNQLPGYDQVAAIESWIRNVIRYLPGTSNIPLSAMEIYYRQSGVCRDLAHLGIALCRSLCIPARMVVGYLYQLEPMDMHAWFEAYIAGRWYTFDATQPQINGGYVAIGYGRDAADVAIYNQFGPEAYPATQNINVQRLED